MAPKQAEKLARKSRYIEGLLDKAKERAREQDIIYERTCVQLCCTPCVWCRWQWPLSQPASMTATGKGSRNRCCSRETHR